MNFFNSRFIYWLIGAIVIPIIVIFVYNSFFSKKNNDGKKYVQEYIDQSIEIELIVPSAKEVYSKSGNFRAGLRQFGSGLVGYDKDTFYDINYGKYFSVNRMRPANDFTYYALISYILHDLKINAIVNKIDLNNASYGTKEKPVPVFLFTISDAELEKRSTIPRSSYEKCVISNEDYRKNIYYYLSYIMPREEFKERFEKIDE